MSPVQPPFECPVVGISHYQDVAHTATEGMTVQVQAEPDNPHDQNAHVVLLAGRRVGYLPRTLAARMPRMRTGWRGTITQVLRGAELTGLRIRLESAAQTGREDPDPVRRREAQASAQAESAAGATRAPRPGRGDTETAEPGHHESPAETGPLVTARSGRALGRLVRMDDTHAHIDTGARVVAYPRDLVSVDTPLDTA